METTTTIIDPQKIDIGETVAALWREIDETVWNRVPYLGMQSEVAKKLNMSRQGVFNGIRNRNIEVGIALITLKRKREREISAIIGNNEQHPTNNL